MSNLKAYAVTTGWDEGSMIAFAPTPGRARSLCRTADMFADCDFIELEVRRLSEADELADKFGETALDGTEVSHSRAMRDLGWYQLEGTMEPCSICDLFEWEDLPESRLEDTDEYGQNGTCVDCVERKRHVMLHTAGLDQSGRMYRNYYFASAGHSELPVLRALVDDGLMREGKLNDGSKDRVFHLTDAGKHVAQRVWDSRAK